MFVDLLKIKTSDTTGATTDSCYGASTASDATTDAATASGVTVESATAESATVDIAAVRLTTAQRIAADCAKTFSTDSILFCRFCAFKCKLYLLDKYHVDIFKTFIYTKCKVKHF